MPHTSRTRSKVKRPKRKRSEAFDVSMTCSENGCGYLLTRTSSGKDLDESKKVNAKPVQWEHAVPHQEQNNMSLLLDFNKKGLEKLKEQDLFKTELVKACKKNHSKKPTLTLAVTFLLTIQGK